MNTRQLIVLAVSFATGLPEAFPPLEVDTGTGGLYNHAPAVAASPSQDALLAVWRGGSPELGPSEWEIFGRFFTSDGSWWSDQLRLSDVGGTGTNVYAPYEPGAAWNGVGGQALSIWTANEGIPPWPPTNTRFTASGWRAPGSSPTASSPATCRPGPPPRPSDAPRIRPYGRCRTAEARRRVHTPNGA